MIGFDNGQAGKLCRFYANSMFICRCLAIGNHRCLGPYFRDESALGREFFFSYWHPLLIAATGKDAVGGAYGELATTIGWGPVIIASLVCMAVSYACIIALKTMVKKRMLHWFAFYCGLLAVLCLSVMPW